MFWHKLIAKTGGSGFNSGVRRVSEAVPDQIAADNDSFAMNALKNLVRLVLLASAINAGAQTNAPLVITAITNRPVLTPEQTKQAQFAAVARTMPQYYDIAKDSVTEVTTIDQKAYDLLTADSGATINIEAVSFIPAKEKIPSGISLHLLSHTGEWKYLEYHKFTLRYDDHLFPPLELTDKSSVQTDATVYEQFYPELTLEEFRKVAWANKVYFKLGYENFEIPYQTRQKWKLLWKYYDLMAPDQQAADAELKKVIGDKP